MKVPGSGKAAWMPGGASRCPISRLWLPSCPTRACPLKLQSIGDHLGHGRPRQLLLASPARASCPPSQALLEPGLTRAGQDSRPKWGLALQVQ